MNLERGSVFDSEYRAVLLQIVDCFDKISASKHETGAGVRQQLEEAARISIETLNEFYRLNLNGSLLNEIKDNFTICEAILSDGKIDENWDVFVDNLEMINHGIKLHI